MEPEGSLSSSREPCTCPFMKPRSYVAFREKINLPRAYAMKTYAGVGVSSTFLDLGTRWKTVDSSTFMQLYTSGKSLQYPFDKSKFERQCRAAKCYF
jgi:hypothetical protein